MSFIRYLLNRAAERSTWLGLIGLLSSFGISLQPELTSPIITAGVGLASTIAILTKDKN